MFSGVSNKIPLRSELSGSRVKGEKKRRSEEPLDEEAVGGRVAHGDEPSPPPLRRSERDRFTGPSPAACRPIATARTVCDGWIGGRRQRRKKERDERGSAAQISGLSSLLSLHICREKNPRPTCTLTHAPKRRV